MLTLSQRVVFIGHNHVDVVLTLSQRARTVSAADTFLKEMVRGSPVCQLGLPPTKLLIFTNISSTASATSARNQQARQPKLDYFLYSTAFAGLQDVVPGEITKWLVGAELKHSHNVKTRFAGLRHC